MLDLKERKQKLRLTLAKLEELIAQRKPVRQNQDHTDLVQKNRDLEEANNVAQAEILAKNKFINELKEKNNRAVEEIDKLIDKIEKNEE